LQTQDSGSDKNKPMFNVNISIQVNKDGIFEGVLENGKLIKKDDWNKRFTGNE
jgi:hypothetical protein